MKKSAVSAFSRKSLLKKLTLLVTLICLSTSAAMKYRADGSVKMATTHIDQDAPLDSHDGCVLNLIPHEREPTWQTDHGKARLLQETPAPRNMRILTYFPEQETINGINVADLAKNYQIAAHYYETIFKVFPFEQNQDTRFSGSCGQIAIPDQISQNGFDVNTVDTVILNRIYSENSGTLAFAGPCQFIRRPVISQINFNAYSINSFLNGFQSNYDWHQLVVLTMHEMGHIFGVLGWAYQNYWWSSSQGRYVSRLYDTPALDSRRLTYDEIIAENVDNDSGREYMILPKVKEYSDSIFQCNEPVTGAKMQEGASHWDYPVWDRELMVPFLGVLENRISPLTNSLYFETGWYADVQISASYNLYRGQAQGCNFMKGSNLNFNEPIACNSSRTQNQCDIYSNYFGTCQSNGRVSRRTTCQINNPDTRCFETANNAACVKAICTSDDPITVTLFEGNNEAVCQEGGAPTVSLNGNTYNCPDNYEIFCDSQTCDDWCDKKGVCINGQCILDEPYCREAVNGCEHCFSDLGNPEIQCSTCEAGKSLVNGACVDGNACLIDNCASCSTNGEGQQICSECVSDNFELSEDKKSCEIVSQNCPENTPNCNGCDQSNNCNSCNTPWVLQAGNPASCVVPECSSEVTGCTSCEITSDNVFKCTGCAGDREINSANGQCEFQACSDQYPNCNDCSQSGDQQTCQDCNAPYSLIDGVCTIVCDIDNCQSCSLDGNTVICQTCTGDWQKSANSQACEAPNTQTCNVYIENCASCSFDQANNDLNCDSCDAEFEVTEDGQECEPIQPDLCNTLEGCDDCFVNNNGVPKCRTCSQGYAKKQGECFQCPEDCENCKAIIDFDDFIYTFCTRCEPGFVKVDGECIECDVENCDSCRVFFEEDDFYSVECKRCSEGFQQFQGQCFACDLDNCDKCRIRDDDFDGEVEVTCQRCAPGFSKFQGLCYECDIDNCQRCRLRDNDQDGNPEAFCKRCEDGYSKVNGECQPNF